MGSSRGSPRETTCWFLDRLNGAAYIHLPRLAPSPEIRDTFRKDHDWDTYVLEFEALLDERAIPATPNRASFEESVSCLLCSESAPEQCHRRLVAERLAQAWPGVEIIHLG